MIRRPPLSNRTEPLLPYPTLFRSGEYDGSHSERVQALVTSFASTGIDAQASSDIERTLWEKYVFLVGLSATTALTRMPIGVVRQTPETRDLLRSEEQTSELQSLMRISYAVFCLKTKKDTKQ